MSTRGSNSTKRTVLPWTVLSFVALVSAACTAQIGSVTADGGTEGGPVDGNPPRPDGLAPAELKW